MPRVDLNAARDVIIVETNFQDRGLMLQVPGARWDASRRHWYVPLGWPSCVILRGLFGDRLEVGEQLAEWAWNIRDTRVDEVNRLRDLLEPNFKHVRLDLIEAESALRLKPYQVVDAEFLITNQRAILAQPMGLGKTATVIRTLQLIQDQSVWETPFPAIVVCPNSTKFTVWQTELARWAPELIVQVVDGGAATRRKQLAEPADVYVINWEALRLHSRVAPFGSTHLNDTERTPKELNALGHRTVILDEAHRAKDPHAKQTRAAWAVAHQANYRFALTGTPIADHVGDLWSLLHLVEPTWFPAKTRFMDRYAETVFGLFGGSEVIGIKAENRDELFSVVNPLIRRVPKKLALPQLPAKLPVQYRHTKMTPTQAKAYHEMEERMLTHLESVLIAPSQLAQLTRLLQFASASASIDETDQLHLTSPSGKVDDLVDLLEEMGDEPLVVVAVSRQLIELAAKKLTELKISHGLVTGAVSPEDRKLAVDRFQNGKIRVILLTLGAGAEGLTLTRASTMLFMQRSFSEVQNQQAEDRIHRIGAEGHDCITIIDQITPGTVEERKRDLLAAKGERIEEIIRDREVLIRLLGGGG